MQRSSEVEPNPMSHSSATVSRQSRREGPRRPSRFASACLVVGAHVAVISWLADRTIHDRRPQFVSEPITAELIAVIRNEAPEAGIQLLPVEQAIQLEMPELPVAAEPETSIDEPRIDPILSADIAPYSARADLTPGLIATILLLLDISPDGSVTSAQVIRSNAGDAANAAAIQYAHATHWMPGKVGGEPRAMQASLTVILGERI